MKRIATQQRICLLFIHYTVNKHLINAGGWMECRYSKVALFKSSW